MTNCCYGTWACTVHSPQQIRNKASIMTFVLGEQILFDTIHFPVSHHCRIGPISWFVSPSVSDSSNITG